MKEYKKNEYKRKKMMLYMTCRTASHFLAAPKTREREQNSKKLESCGRRSTNRGLVVLKTNVVDLNVDN